MAKTLTTRVNKKIRKLSQYLADMAKKSMPPKGKTQKTEEALELAQSIMDPDNEYGLENYGTMEEQAVALAGMVIKLLG